MLINRTLNISDLLKKKSFFLFGPRSTGKSTIIKQQLREVTLINLLKSNYYRRLARRPEDLEGIIAESGNNKIIVIDEIQKIPELLDEVHRLIEEQGLTFLLTGSSARKLRTGGVNLLAGRAWEANLFPLTSQEIPGFNLERYLRYGGLPQVYFSADPEEELDAYVNTYLTEEIRAEGLVRKHQAFSRFLYAAALANAETLNYHNLARDAEISPSTIREYFSLLEDTLVGFTLEPWSKSKRRKAIAAARFYFFDLGVTHTLAETTYIEKNSDLYGRSFEHFIALELRAYLAYRRIKNKPLRYWRTTSGDEVDFIIGDDLAIEVKATNQVQKKHLKGLRKLQEEQIVPKLFLVSNDQINREEDGITVLHWQTFLHRLWSARRLEDL